MEDFNNIVNDVMEHNLKQLRKGILDEEMLLSIYYIYEHVKNGQNLSQENLFFVKTIIKELIRNYEKQISSNLIALIYVYLLRSIDDIKNEEKIRKDFFLIYLYMDNYSNIRDKLDYLKLLYPDDNMKFYVQNLIDAFEKSGFWELNLIEKKKLVYKLFYVTIILYEREVATFKLIFEALHKVFIKAIELNEEELIYFLYTPLQFSWNGVSSTQEELTYYNNVVEKPLEEFIKSHVMPAYNLVPCDRNVSGKKVIKVAFLQERLINYSIYKVFKALLKSLSDYENTTFEFIVLDLNFKELSGSFEFIQNEVKEMKFKFIDCHKMFSDDDSFIYSIKDKTLALRKWILDNEIDVLIGMHSRPEYNILFTSRTTPIQVYWSHGNYEYDIENIDYRIKHGFIGNKFEEINGKYFYQFPDYLTKKELNPNIDQSVLYNIKSNLPQNVIVLGTIGRLSKLTNEEYLSVIESLMKKYTNTIYLACGSGNQEAIKVKIKDEEVLKRFFFLGHVDSAVYGNLIDIWPNTFPNNQGTSTLEAVAKGVLNIQMITNQFSDFDKKISKVEKLYQRYEFSIENVLNDNEIEYLVNEFLEENFFPADKIDVSKFTIPSILYSPTNSITSYKSKLDYAIKNHSLIKEDVKEFSLIMAENRWMNQEACLKGFITNLENFVDGM